MRKCSLRMGAVWYATDRIGVLCFAKAWFGAETPGVESSALISNDRALKGMARSGWVRWGQARFGRSIAGMVGCGPVVCARVGSCMEGYGLVWKAMVRAERPVRYGPALSGSVCNALDAFAVVRQSSARSRSVR